MCFLSTFSIFWLSIFFTATIFTYQPIRQDPSRRHLLLLYCCFIFLPASLSWTSKCRKIFILLLKLSSHKIMFIERGVGGREEGLRTPCPSRRVRRRGRPRPGGICRSWRCQPCSGPWAGWAESGSVSPDRPSQNPENNQIYDLSLSLSPQQRSDLIKLFKALQSRVQP